jgi:hypothetical protein
MVALVLTVGAALSMLAGCGGGSHAPETTSTAAQPAGNGSVDLVSRGPLLTVARREARLERLVAESSRRCFETDAPVVDELACHDAFDLANALARRVDDAIGSLKGRGITTSFLLRAFRQEAAAAWARSVETATAAALRARSGGARKRLAVRFRDLSDEGRSLVAAIHTQAVELSHPVQPSRGERTPTELGQKLAGEIERATEPDRGDTG